MPTLEQRIASLEGAVTESDYRPLPLGYFYSEPLAPDFYTNEAYVKQRGTPRAEFYLE